MPTRHPEDQRYFVRAQVKEFGIPPVHDGLVLGRAAPIGYTAIRKAVELLVNHSFEHFQLKDDVIADVLIRSSILRRMPREKIIDFILRRIKPLMGPEEILHLDLETEIEIEDNA